MVPVMIGALVSVTTKFEKWLENKEVTYRPLVICMARPIALMIFGNDSLSNICAFFFSDNNNTILIER